MFYYFNNKIICKQVAWVRLGSLGRPDVSLAKDILALTDNTNRHANPLLSTFVNYEICSHTSSFFLFLGLGVSLSYYPFSIKHCIIVEHHFSFLLNLCEWPEGSRPSSLSKGMHALSFKPNSLIVFSGQSINLCTFTLLLSQVFFSLLLKMSCCLSKTPLLSNLSISRCLMGKSYYLLLMKNLLTWPLSIDFLLYLALIAASLHSLIP